MYYILGCLRVRSAYENEVSTDINLRPKKKKGIRFNDWLNKVKII